MTGKNNISIARVYNLDAKNDGIRLLVDRLWPRGIAKKEIDLDDWIMEVAPSNELRKWFGHDPEKWDDFRKRYRAELSENPDAVRRCLDWLRKDNVTLLYGARDKEHNQAVVLRDYLLEKIEKE
tara:strand:+ start:631 stop:1002 length:372 start_codon:yes stop_codon:yes gene_type:complete